MKKFLTTSQDLKKFLTTSQDSKKFLTTSQDSKKFLTTSQDSIEEVPYDFTRLDWRSSLQLHKIEVYYDFTRLFRSLILKIHELIGVPFRNKQMFTSVFVCQNDLIILFLTAILFIPQVLSDFYIIEGINRSLHLYSL